MDYNYTSSFVGAGISAGIYGLFKSLKYYYTHYYLKSVCHNNNELVISLETKEVVVEMVPPVTAAIL